MRRLNAAVMSACAAGSSGAANTHSARWRSWEERFTPPRCASVTWRSSAMTAGDGGAGGGAQALGAGLPRVRAVPARVFGEPGAQRRPAAAPVVALVGVGEERPVVGPGGEGEHRAVTRSAADTASTAAMAAASLGR